MSKEIAHNAIQTPDGTILVSSHRHDYITHVDTISHETYMVDGGCAYLRRNINKVSAKELSLTTDAPFNELREVMSWGTYGKKGDQPLVRVLIKALSDDHLTALITEDFGDAFYKYLFKEEVAYRESSL